MPFTPETGQGLEDANAYISVAFADTYHSDRGHVSWTALSTAKKEQCIVRATDYIDKRFGRRFRGSRRSQRQALEWPRLDAFDDDRFLLSEADEIPRALSKACAEYALRAALLGELAPDPPLPVPVQDLGVNSPATPPSGDIVTGQVSSKAVKVGPIEEKTAYQTASEVASRTRNKQAMGFTVSDFNIPEYPAADLLLEELLKTNAQRRLARG